MIAVDADHGERAPHAPVRAAVKAASMGHRVTLVGDRRAIADAMPRRAPPIEVVASTAALDEAAGWVASGRVEALVSAARPAEVITAALAHSGLHDGVEAPALCATLPSLRAPFVMLDLGASGSPTGAQLEAFAGMGARMAERLLDRPSPSVALLMPDRSAPIASAADAHARLQAGPLAYRGGIDGRAVFQGDVDVIVTDGVTGQTLIETVEGLSAGIERVIRDNLTGSFLVGAGALLFSRLGKSFGDKLDYAGAGAGVLLGVAGLHVVAHPRSGEKMWLSAIRTAAQLRQKGL